MSAPAPELNASATATALPFTLVVHCHPDPGSFSGTLAAGVVEALRGKGRACRCIDLYREGFQPCMSAPEWQDYKRPGAPLPPDLQDAVQALRQATHLVFVYPVWMSGPPALLKGWLDRVWRPGVAFQRPLRPGGLPQPALLQIRRITVVSTGNAARWWTWLQGDPNRRLFTRGLRAFCAPRCRVDWLHAHRMQLSTQATREAFAARVCHRVTTG
jgi:putative NADPH-quinone reductase